MGLTVVLAHFNGTQWKNFTVEPPGGNYNDYAVVGLKLGRNVVHVSYKVRIRGRVVPLGIRG